MTTELIECDIAVIGAGAGGLVVAAGAAMLGRRTVLIERGEMGGDCLNAGCVPSKALIAAARQAHMHHEAAAFGIRYAAPAVDFPAVMAHVRETIAAIAPNDSVARFEGLGVTVLRGEAAFTGPGELVCGDQRIRARRTVIATGSRPAIPDLPGLAACPHLTNETVFSLTDLPRHLIILGAGPAGCELAQAFRRLGSIVTLVERQAALPREDAELRQVVLRQLVRDGVTLRENATVTEAAPAPGGVALTLADGSRIEGSHLLVVTGRRANTEALNLPAAGITTHPGGITVDAGLRTSNPHVFAIGDVTGQANFTHVAGHHAGLVLRAALFRMPVRADLSAVPRATYTDPEIAAVGLDEAAARALHGDIRILRWPFSENDRARTERRTEGMVKIITTPRGKILGAAIVGSGAGDLIQPCALAVSKSLDIGALQAMITAYPTRSEALKRAAGEFFRPKVMSPFMRWLAAFLARFG